MNSLDLINLFLKGIGFAVLFGATYLMLRESTCELQYLKRAWNTGALKYRVAFLTLVILMYLFSLCPVAMGILFVMYKDQF